MTTCVQVDVFQEADWEGDCHPYPAASTTPTIPTGNGAAGEVRKLPTLGFRQLPKPIGQPLVKVEGSAKPSKSLVGPGEVGNFCGRLAATHAFREEFFIF